MKTTLKKSFAAFTAFLTAGLIAVSNTSVSAEEEIPEIRNGDTNADGIVNLYDVINISKYVMDSSVLEGESLTQADYNKDTVVNIYDAIFISRLILAEENINEVITLINSSRRIMHDLEPLEFDQSLVDASMKRASELPKKWSGETRPNGSNYKTILLEYGIVYEKCGYCITAVPSTPQEVLNALLNNEVVKTRLMSDNYTKIGVGYCGMDDEYKHYWSVLLTG